ncbi:MAG: tyrosine-type recombinase/integrase [Mesorhizobium sp.]|nr:tyrosine-type recombinase/integrase [Mesorhizobium sp.]
MARKPRRYLVLKGNIYWFKRDIPTAIRQHFGGKTAYLESLDTGDVLTARDRRDAVERAVDGMFANAKAGTPLVGSQDAIRDLGEIWAAELTESRADPYAWTAKTSGRSVAEVADEEVDSAEGFIHDKADDIERSYGAAGKARFLGIAFGRVAVDFHLAAHLAEASALAPKTLNGWRGQINRFAAWAGVEGLDLGDVDRRAAGRYVTAKIVPMNSRTAAKHLSALKTYWTYLIGRGHAVGENPWEGQIKARKGKRAERSAVEKERPFTDKEMQTLLFADYPKKLNKAHREQIHDAIRMAALSGLRLAEVITLQVAECQNGMFDIQQGKTATAARRVPIHSELEGIIGRRTVGKSLNDWLFHELSKERDPGDIFGKRFGRYRERLGVAADIEGKRRSLVNFHSFRRWFITEAERAGQPETTIAAVVGHAAGRRSMTFGVYSGGPSDEQRRACVEAVKAPVSLASVRHSGMRVGGQF